MALEDVNRAPLGGERRLAQRLAVGRMRMDRRDHLVRGQLRTHGERELGDEVGGVWPVDRRAQDLSIVSQNHLGKALGLAGSDRLAIADPWELSALPLPPPPPP